MQMGPCEKQNKAALARELEKKVSPVETIPTPSKSIIDGMGLVQTMNGNNKTFAQLTEYVLSMVKYCMWVDRVVALVLSLTYTASRQSNMLKD